MRKFQFTQLTKTAAGFGLFSAMTIDAWLLAVDNFGLLDVPGNWYWNGPLVAWGLVGVPLSISLGERLLDTAYRKPGGIVAVESTAPAGSSGLRPIPFNKNGQPGTIFASAQRWAIGDRAAPGPGRDDEDRRTVAWRIPVGDSVITIGEVEITKFLELASKRGKHQFSRRYWTKRRRPPIPVTRYNALMRLLSGSGLVEARQSGASGYLVGGIKTHNAVSYLKYESPYRI